MQNDDLPFDLDDLSEMLFGEHSATRHTYKAKWVDYFWDEWFTGAIVSATLDDAIDLAESDGPDTAELESVEGPDGHAWCLSSGHTVREARVLVETPAGLVEETIAALTHEMALDTAALLFGDTCTVLGVQEGTRLQWTERPDDAFLDRPDLPAGWAWARAGGAR